MKNCTTGAGKSMRDGEGFQTTGTYASGALDTVVQNCTIIDPVQGIVRPTSASATGGSSASARPATHHGQRRPCAAHGPNTTVIHGDMFICTAGAIEAHAHFLSPQQWEHALARRTTN